MVKIKFGLAITLVCAASYFMAQRIYSANRGQSLIPAVSVNTAVQPMVPPKSDEIASRPAAATEIFMPYCFMASAGNPNTMPEKELRSYVVKCTKTLLAEKEFKSLDAMIGFLRGKKIRTPSGLWLQSFYYGGIEEFVGQARSDAEFDALEADFRQWLAVSPDSEAAHLALSTAIISRGWFYRGDGYASTVSENAGKKYQSQISRAKKLLLENETISERDPEWYSQMFIVLRAGAYDAGESYESYFARAAKSYPEYYPLYFSAATYYLSKWNGDDEAFDRFARSGADILSPEQAGALYARIYWSHACDRCNDVASWREHWDDINTGFEQIIRDFPDQWNINNYARIACSAYDQDKTLELLQKIKGMPIADAWNDEQFSYDYCANWSGFSKGTDDVK